MPVELQHFYRPDLARHHEFSRTLPLIIRYGRFKGFTVPQWGSGASGVVHIDDLASATGIPAQAIYVVATQAVDEEGNRRYRVDDGFLSVARVK